MAALDAIKSRRITDPAAIERLSQNIQAGTVEALGGTPAGQTPRPAAPEASPAIMSAAPPAPAPAPAAARVAISPPAAGQVAPAGTKVDLRTLRRTGRTFPINTKVKPETGDRLTQIARDSGKSLAEVIEAMVAKEPQRQG